MFSGWLGGAGLAKAALAPLAPRFCYTDPSAIKGKQRQAAPRRYALQPMFGEWLSLVEHLVRDQGVGGSNPLSPTNKINSLQTLYLGQKIRCRRFCSGDFLLVFSSVAFARNSSAPSENSLIETPRSAGAISIKAHSQCLDPVFRRSARTVTNESRRRRLPASPRGCAAPTNHRAQAKTGGHHPGLDRPCRPCER